MSVSAAEYYAGVMELPADLVAPVLEPVVVFDKSEAARILGVRWEGRDCPIPEVDARLTAYVSAFANHVGNILPLGDDTTPWRDNPACCDIRMSALLKTLLPRKVVTGRFDRLLIEAVVPYELPATLTRYFDTVRDRQLSASELIPGRDLYFRVQAQMTAGARVGHMACCLCVAPYKMKGERHVTRERRTGKQLAHLGFKQTAQKYPSTDGTVEAAWKESVQIARAFSDASASSPLRIGFNK